MHMADALIPPGEWLKDNRTLPFTVLMKKLKQRLDIFCEL